VDTRDYLSDCLSITTGSSQVTPLTSLYFSRRFSVSLSQRRCKNKQHCSLNCRFSTTVTILHTERATNQISMVCSILWLDFFLKSIAISLTALIVPAMTLALMLHIHIQNTNQIYNEVTPKCESEAHHQVLQQGIQICIHERQQGAIALMLCNRCCPSCHVHESTDTVGTEQQMALS